MYNNSSIAPFKIPMPLKQGDTIGICAPSGIFNKELFSHGINTLELMGFNVYIPSAIYNKKRYMSGDDHIRADVINSLFANNNIHGIICARGGFGALRTLDYIDYNLIAHHPKMFIGFSDITALLLAISEKTHMQVIHGPVVTTLANASALTLESFYEQLTLLPSCSNIVLNLDKGRILRKGVAAGRLTGGNLATLCHLTGTQFQPDLNGAILFLEDVGEPPYKIDRMLTHMKIAGMFKKIKGVITGSFEKCVDSKKEYNIEEYNIENTIKKDTIHETQEIIDEIILEIFDNPELPVISGLDVGHGKINLSLRFSAMVKIDGEKKKIFYI